MIYITNENFNLLNNNLILHNEIRFLAPLDNLLWERDFIESVFDFSYRWEVYKPAKDRKYGYYILPILYGNKIIGRFEPILNKQDKKLYVKNWWWEKNIKLNNNIKNEVNKELDIFAKYLNASINTDIYL